MRKVPFSLVISACWPCRAGPEMTTVAPMTGSLEVLSMTRPRTEPVVLLWATATSAAKSWTPAKVPPRTPTAMAKEMPMRFMVWGPFTRRRSERPRSP